MNYEKLSRALRFYYGQGIIQKVSVENLYCNLKDVLTCGYVTHSLLTIILTWKSYCCMVIPEKGSQTQIVGSLIHQ